MKKMIKKSIIGGFSGLLALPMMVSAAAVTDKISGVDLPKTKLMDLLDNVLQIGIGLIGVLGVLSFLWAGVQYLTAGGEKDRVENAKKTALYGALGILVALCGYIIVVAIQSFLGGATEF